MTRKTVERVRLRIATRGIGERFSAADIAREVKTITATSAGNILKWQPEVRKVSRPGYVKGMKCSINPWEWEKIAEVPV